MGTQISINVLKGLIIDGVHKAQSGHPGGPLSALDFTYILFKEFLKFDPKDPQWMGRDRFILSAGHASMLQYALLHFNGWLSIDDLKSFRQLDSKTPGHPENTHTPGVECTTGPLGQGAAMSVGFAIANAHLQSTFGRDLFDQHIYAVLGDGCIQEDITLGAASLAGHLGLSNLVWFYDRNRVQISGAIDRATSDDDEKVFTGFGWNVLKIDGHDHAEIRKAIQSAQKESERPTLIIGRTVIAHGVASMEGSAKTHGAPLPDDERKKTKQKLGLPDDKDFYCPQEAIASYQEHFSEKSRSTQAWKQTLAKKKSSDPDFAKQFDQYFGEGQFKSLTLSQWQGQKPIATRSVFGKVLEKWVYEIPNLVGGSADLEPSNMTEAFAEKVGDFARTHRKGRNLVFGVREFPMSAICNGIALHGGLIPFDATFLAFSDYSRPALRLGAIQKVRVIHEFTHDSFYLGEDGPTHQPVEQVMSLRLIPDFYVMRPCDAYETEIMMQEGLRLKAPSALCLTRQNLPIIAWRPDQIEDIRRGAVVVHDVPDARYLILATGSEVSLAMEVVEFMKDYRFRVVSMPCWELFANQSQEFKNRIIPKSLSRRISIEAGTTLGWQAFTGSRGLNIGLDHFGASAPAKHLAQRFGFTKEAVAERIRKHNFESGE